MSYNLPKNKASEYEERQNILTLREQKELLEREIAELKAKKNDIDDVSNELEILRVRLLSEEDSLAELQESKKKAEDQLISLNAEVATRQDKLSEVGNSIKMLNVEKTALEARNMSLTSGISSLNKEYASVQDSIDKKQKHNETIIMKETAVTELDELISEKEEHIKALDDKVNEMTRTLESLETQIASQKSELDERDGDLSVKERSLAVKEEQLRRAKIELEEFYGRKLKHITI